MISFANSITSITSFLPHLFHIFPTETWHCFNAEVSPRIPKALQLEVFDVASGRGGDQLKFVKAQPCRALGVDSLWPHVNIQLIGSEGQPLWSWSINRNTNSFKSFVVKWPQVSRQSAEICRNTRIATSSCTKTHESWPLLWNHQWFFWPLRFHQISVAATLQFFFCGVFCCWKCEEMATGCWNGPKKAPEGFFRKVGPGVKFWA